MKKSDKITKKPKAETPKIEPIARVAPEISEGLISLAMTKEDMRTFANLLSITARTFERLALQAAEKNDEATFTLLQARHKLSFLFAEKLIEACRMPEPVSRDFH